LFLSFQGVNQENVETTATVSVQEFRLICKEADREIESGFSGIFAQRRTYEKAEAYIRALSGPQVAVKSTWEAAEYSGYDNPGPFQSLIGENKWRPEDIWDRVAVKARLFQDHLNPVSCSVALVVAM
jgi:hypothetical protein